MNKSPATAFQPERNVEQDDELDYDDEADQNGSGEDQYEVILSQEADVDFHLLDEIFQRFFIIDQPIFEDFNHVC